MCDVNKYSNMFQDMKTLQPEDTLQLILQAKDKDERDFFEMLGNFLLQKKQKEVIERNLFWMEKYILIAGVNGAGKSTLYQTLDSLKEMSV